jgi:hypothetical protein
MDKATYDRGLKIRKGVLGDEFVDKAIASADDFNRPSRTSRRNIAGAMSGVATGFRTRRAAFSTLRCCARSTAHTNSRPMFAVR